jgi:hypothetical protein
MILEGPSMSRKEEKRKGWKKKRSVGGFPPK